MAEADISSPIHSLEEMHISSSLTFLDLPEHVRHSIYSLAGLICPCSIDLVVEGLRHHNGRPEVRPIESEDNCPFATYPWENICHAPKFPVSLLRVSRRVYEEVSWLLYSTHKFSFKSCGMDDLRYLNRLAPNSIEALTSLEFDGYWGSPSSTVLVW